MDLNDHISRMRAEFAISAGGQVQQHFMRTFGTSQRAPPRRLAPQPISSQQQAHEQAVRNVQFQARVKPQSIAQPRSTRPMPAATPPKPAPPKAVAKQPEPIPAPVTEADTAPPSDAPTSTI